MSRNHNLITPLVAGLLTALVVATVAWVLERSEARRFEQEAAVRTLQQLSTVRADAESSP